MSVKTSFEEIVSVRDIGEKENPIVMNELLKKGKAEKLKPAHEDNENILMLIIDPQKDFMEKGSLGVPGAHKDIENLTRFIYKHMEKISRIKVSLDTHIPFQIFHPAWWIDKEGNNPEPFTQITYKDLEEGNYKPVIYPRQSIEYVKKLEEDAKKVLTIWPYHCLRGTEGHSVENQLANMLYFHSVARKAVLETIVKGTDPLSEMYGIIKPEYDTKNYINTELLNDLGKYDKIVVAGEAKSHCVMESVRQILEYYEDRPDVTSKIFILEDCMSNIGGFEKITEDVFNMFKNKYKINIVKSTDLNL